MRIVLNKSVYTKHFSPLNSSELSKEAKHKLKVIDWHFSHGRNISLTSRYFGHSRTTITEWLKRYEPYNLKTLECKSKRPKNTPRKRVDLAIAERIKALRRMYPEFGKHKIWVLIDKIVSESTVGRYIEGMPGAPRRYAPGKKTKYRKKLRKPSDYTVKEEGDLVALDTIVLQRDGCKRYIIVAIDVFSRVAVARTFKSPSSRNAADVLKRLSYVLGPVKSVITDNGSEFMKDFNIYCDQENIKHFHTYPRSPKMNPYAERFNRTLQESATLPHTSSDISEWNYALYCFLIRYNTFRPHDSLKDMTPLEYLLKAINPTSKVFSMLWTTT